MTNNERFSFIEKHPFYFKKLENRQFISYSFIDEHLDTYFFHVPKNHEEVTP